MRRPGPSPHLTGYEAERAIALWNTKFYDTSDIAEILCVKPDAVWRLLQAARDIRYEQRRSA